MIEKDEKKKLGILPKIGIVLLTFIIFLFVYMRFFEPSQLEILEYPIYHEKIPESFNGFKIVQFSDIHFGKTTNEKELERVVEKINLLKPDILVFTGDLFDDNIQVSMDTKNKIQKILSKTTAKIGKYAIKGCQDYQDDFESILEQANFTVLKNQNIPIYYEGNTPIYLGGIPSISKNEENLTEALKKEENAYQILIMHEPILWDEIGNVDLALAGHSLGGSIRLFFTDGLIRLENTSHYQKGLFYKGDSILAVSSGIGTHDFDFRLFNEPSISLYRLYHK